MSLFQLSAQQAGGQPEAAGLDPSILGIDNPEELAKSLTAGQPYPAAAPGNLAPVMPESLDGTITSLLFKRNHIRFQEKLAEMGVDNTVHQYVRQSSYGTPTLAWVAEGAIPSVESAPSWSREYAKLKIAVELYQVTDVARIVKILPGAGANALAANTTAASLNLLSKIEEDLFFGSEALCPLAIDGLATQMIAAAPTQITDMRGESLTQDSLDEGVANVMDRAGMLDAVWMSNKSKRILGQLEIPKRRYGPNEVGNQRGKSGMPMAGQISQVNDEFVPYEPSYFLQSDRGGPVGAVGASAPAAPLLTSDTVAAGGADNLFQAADAGKYYYVVEAWGPNGISASFTSAQQTIAAGEKCTLVMNDAAIADVWFYKVYRSSNNGAASTARFMVSVPFGGVTTIVDENADIPGTCWAFGVSYDPEILQTVRLGVKAARIELARLGTAQRFMVVSVLGLMLKAPSKLWAWKNCGQSL